MNTKLEEAKNKLNLFGYQLEELATYPEFAVNHAIDVVLRKEKDCHKFSYLRGVLQNYCQQHGISRNVPVKEPLVVKEDFFTHVKEDKDEIYKPFHSTSSLQLSEREQRIKYAYPWLEAGEYDDIKNHQAAWLRQLGETTDKQQVADIKEHLYHLSQRLQGNRGYKSIYESGYPRPPKK